ncbi:MAG: starch synthase, partial [Cardiobacterium hominis]
TLENGSATGFVFHQATSDALIQSIGRMLENWHNAKQWAAVRANAMAQDNSWHKAASAYEALYNRL